MILSAKVKNGAIVLEDDQALPEGTAVTVSVPQSGEPATVAEVMPGEIKKRTLYDRLKKVVGRATNFPEDASLNIDHYLYGQPKR